MRILSSTSFADNTVNSSWPPAYFVRSTTGQIPQVGFGFEASSRLVGFVPINYEQEYLNQLPSEEVRTRFVRAIPSANGSSYAAYETLERRVYALAALLPAWRWSVLLANSFGEVGVRIHPKENLDSITVLTLCR